MKYAIQGRRGAINRISDTEPQSVPANATVVEITDEQAATIQDGIEAYPKQRYAIENGELVDLRGYLKRQAFLNQPLEEAKATKTAEIKAAREVAEHGGVTVAPFGLLPTDSETQSKLTAVYVKALNDPTYTKNWKVGDTTWATLDAATIIAIGDAVEVHVQAQFDKEETLTVAALASTTVEELAAIVW